MIRYNDEKAFFCEYSAKELHYVSKPPLFFIIIEFFNLGVHINKLLVTPGGILKIDPIPQASH